MKYFAGCRKISFIALGALAMMLAVSAPSQAAENFRGGHGGHFEGHDGRHFDGHEGDRFEGHRHFGFGPIFPYYAPYYSAPGYWYYCPSYNAYYPFVTSCPDAWVPFPAQ